MREITLKIEPNFFTNIPTQTPVLKCLPKTAQINFYLCLKIGFGVLYTMWYTTHSPLMCRLQVEYGFLQIISSSLKT